MIETYKMANGIYDDSAIPKLEFRKDNVSNCRTNRGHSKQLYITRSKKEVRKNFFTQRIAPVWNALPEKIVSAPSVNCFKNYLDKHWANHPMKFDYKQPVR